MRATLLFSIALTAVLVVGASLAAERNHSRELPLPWDGAVFVGNALRIRHAMAERGIVGFADAWVHVSATHAPLVPATSAIAMVFLGESREAAEAVLPLFVFLYVLSVARCAEILLAGRVAHPRAAAWLAAFLAATFPIALWQSRTYLFEFPLAAMTAAALWCGLATDGFAKRWQSLAFGAVAGLAAVSRAGGFVAMAGPAAVLLVIALRARGARAVLPNAGLALAAAVAVAGTWYIPNFRALSDYIYSVTYGERASVFAEGGSSLSLAGIGATFHALALEGPGVPALAIGAAAFLLGRPWRRGAAIRPLLVSLFVAFAADFALLSLASQKAGAALVLPILPILALAMAACAFFVARPRLRVALAALLAATGAHHLYAVTLGFDPDPASKSGNGPFAPTLRLWSHQDMLSRIVGDAWRERRWSEWLRAVADRLQTAHLGRRPIIHLLSQNPYYSSGNLELEGLLRHEDWWVLSVPISILDPFERNRDEVEKSLLYADAFVVRRRRLQDEGVFDQIVRVAMLPIVKPGAAAFTRLGDPIPFMENETLEVYVRRPDIVWRESAAEYPIRVNATFRDPRFQNPERADVPTIRLNGARYEQDGDHRWVELQLEVDEAVRELPVVFLDVHDPTGKPVFAQKIRKLTFERDRVHPAGRNVAIVRFCLNRAITPGLLASGYLLSAHMGEVGTPDCWGLSAAERRDVTGRRAIFFEAPGAH